MGFSCHRISGIRARFAQLELKILMAEGTRSQDSRRTEESLRNLLKEQKDQFDKEIAALKNLILEVNTQRIQSNQSSFNSDNQEFQSQSGNGYQASTRLSRVEFPKFSEEDFKGWLYKCEQFFKIDGTP